ncbi:MAG: TolC family protein [Sphaerochaeta sp.]
MIKKIIATLTIGGVLLTSPLFARNLSLDQAVGEAINKSSQVLAKVIDIKNAQIDEDTKFSVIYPTISVSGTAYRANEGTTYNFTGTPIVSENYLYLSTTLSASLAFNPAMITALDATSLALENKTISLEQSKRAVALQIKKLYYGILVQESAVGLQEDNIAYMEETLENTEASYKNGDIPELNILQLKSQISSQKATLEKTKTSIVSQKRTLAYLIGIDDITEELNLTDALPTTFNDDLSEYTIDKAFNASYDLQMAKINKQILDITKKATQQSTYAPTVALSASYNPSWYVADGFDLSSTTYSSEGGSLSATVSFNITGMLPGSSSQKSLKQIDVSYEQLELGNTSIRDNIVLNFNSNIEAIKEAKRQIDLSKENIDLSQQSFEMTSLSYENGYTTFSDLQSAQLNVSNAQLTLLQSQYSYVSALLDLKDQCTR